MSSKIQKIYDYIHNLRLKTKRTNFYIQRRRVERGDGHRTLGWILSNNVNECVGSKIKFADAMELKRELESGTH